MDIVIEPGGKYQTPDPVLGLRPLPGSYTGFFDQRDQWHFTHLADTTRITRPLETYASASRGPGIWVFGCSFVQGWGLDDAAVAGYGGVQDLSLRSHEVSEQLIAQFAEQSRRHGVHFVRAGISSWAITRATLGRFAARGIPTVDIAVDLDNPANRIPYDGHPNARANEEYARGIAAVLRSARIIN